MIYICFARKRGFSHDFDDNVDVFIFSCCVLIIRHATVNCILFARKRGPFHNVDVHDDNDDNNT